MPLKTISYRTNNPYEEAYGYSRAVRRGNMIFVSGTTSVDPNLSPTPVVLHPGDAYSQTVTAFCESIAAVKKLGGKSEDIVRVKMFVRREEDADAVGKGMKDTLSGAWAATMIVGVGFVNREMLVEVEVDAVVEL